MSFFDEKDIANISSKIFQLLQKTPREEVKKINEETFLVSLYIKDSVVKSTEVFAKANSFFGIFCKNSST